MNLRGTNLSRRTAGILFLFMTLLMGFPFFFYYRYSALESNVLTINRVRIGEFGSELRRSLENLPPEKLDRETAVAMFLRLPLVPDLGSELYDNRGELLAERPGLPLGYEKPAPDLYRTIKSLIDPVRALFAETGSKDARDVKLNLLRIALGGNRGVDYIFSSGDAGDRILYFSYPLRQFTKDGPVVRGVLLLEYRDRAAAIIIQKQRNQFALMCLIFLFILLTYLLFILTAFVFPLRKLSRKIQAVANRTEYLLPDDKKLKRNREIGEIIGKIEALTEIQNSREQEMEEYVSELKHIIRNPLTIVRVSLEGLLLDRHSDRDRALADIIRNNLYRIERHVSSYNPLPELSGEEKSVETISLGLFFGELMAHFATLAEQRQVRFELHIQEDLRWRGFPSHLTFACEQIISNAVDFSPEGGAVAIEASASDRFIIIGISDQGPGIPPGKEKEIFRQHASFRQNSRDNHSGTGLFLTAKVMRKIGGTVSARNGERGGALLLLTLPRQI